MKRQKKIVCYVGPLEHSLDLHLSLTTPQLTPLGHLFSLNPLIELIRVPYTSLLDKTKRKKLQQDFLIIYAGDTPFSFDQALDCAKIYPHELFIFIYTPQTTDLSSSDLKKLFPYARIFTYQEFSKITQLQLQTLIAELLQLSLEISKLEKETPLFSSFKKTPN